MGGGPATLSGHLLLTLPWPEPTEVTDRIRKEHPDLKITYIEVGGRRSREPGKVPDETYKDVTFLSTLGTLPKNPDLIPNIKFIHFNSAGLDFLADHPILSDTKIPLTTSSGIHGPAISEYILLSTLVSSHRYHLLHHWQLSQRWGGAGSERATLSTVHDLVGQRLGVLGYGSIGRQAANVAKAMGMDVYAYTASKRDTAEKKRDNGYIVPGTGDKEGLVPSKWFSGTDKESLHDFLGSGLDVLVVSLPLTKKTTGLLGKKEFEILAKKNAFMINISRGKILVQDELISALKSFDDSEGKEGLRGAALDVTDPEPLPDGHPLWTAPNAIVTPHISGNSVAYAGRAAEVLELNLGRYAKGEALANLVDRDRGY